MGDSTDITIVFGTCGPMIIDPIIVDPSGSVWMRIQQESVFFPGNSKNKLSR